MKYLHQILKAKKGSRIKVHFSQPTKVLLLGEFHYNQYKEHRTYAYRGGELEQSPHTFEIPSDGKWHIVIEKGGYFHPKNIVGQVEMVA